MMLVAGWLRAACYLWRLAAGEYNSNPMAQSKDVVLYRKEGGTAFLTMNRPDKRNALNAEMVGGLRRALKEAADDPEVRVVVLGGAGSVFSAGADLNALEELRSASSEANLADSALLAGLFEDLYLHPKPSIARVHGHAIAGGCGLASVCDFSIVSEEARLGFTEVRIGFVPAIVMVFVLRKLGESAARDLFLTGRMIDAPYAAQLGLITKVAPAADLDAEVSNLATTIAEETSPTAVALTRQLLAVIPGMGFREALNHAVQTNAFARATSDCRSGIDAFLAKTAPPWKKYSILKGSRGEER
jgi:methylglutaconyl-CoA hydratase